jgi:hypothetical protein
MKDTSTNVSAKAVMTAIKPPWFVFDMKARGALTPGVAAEEGAEAGADMLGDDKGQSRFCEHRYQNERRSNRGVDYRDRRRIDGG